MGFFNKVFRTSDKADKTTAEPQDVDFVAALSMHLRGEVNPALGNYLKIAEELPEDNLAPFFASAIKAGEGNIAEAAESLRLLSQRISLKGETISRAISLNLDTLMRNEPFLGVPAVAEIIVSFGDTLKKEGFVQESAVCFEIAAGLVPDNAHVLHKLGDTLHDLGIYDYAESVLLEALKYAPYHWGALYTYAVLLQDLKRYEEAITYYEKAVKVNPDHVKCQNNYGAALMMTNRLDEALAHCTLAAGLAPDFLPVKINLGNIHLLLQEYETARTNYLEAISLDKNLAPAYLGLASVEQLLGSDSGRVRELYLKAIELNPSIPEAHHALGNLLVPEGKPEALTHFSAAAQLNNNLKNLHKDFGNACLQLGMREEALEHLRIAQAQNPDDIATQETLSMLEEETRTARSVDPGIS
jgi:tetratricopeptide (TPR) repeat protein